MRAIASANKQNAVLTAVVHSLMTSLTVEEMMINADGTSFQTGGGLTELVPVEYLPDGHLMKGGPTQKGVCLVCYFIKHYMLSIAAGGTGKPIYILSHLSRYWWMIYKNR